MTQSTNPAMEQAIRRFEEQAGAERMASLNAFSPALERIRTNNTHPAPRGYFHMRNNLISPEESKRRMAGLLQMVRSVRAQVNLGVWIMGDHQITIANILKKVALHRKDAMERIARDKKASVQVAKYQDRAQKFGPQVATQAAIGDMLLGASQ